MNIQRPQSKQPLPEHAKCVFKGIIFDVYQWQQEQYDGTFKTFEKLKREDTIVVIPVTEDGKIIVVAEEQPGKAPFIALPGGRAEENESIETSAARELLEETGYTAERFDLLLAIQPAPKIEWAHITLIGRNCRNTHIQSLDSGERITVRLVEYDEFFDVMTSEANTDRELLIFFLQAKLDPDKFKEIKNKILGTTP